MTVAATDYPLTLRFRILTIGAEIEGTDSSGKPVVFVKQKAFRLREDVLVFRDPSRAEQLYRIRADRVIDIGARYDITDANGTTVGAVKQRGMRSLWHATYDILDAGGESVGIIHEADPWVKVLDGVVGAIPLLGLVLQMFVNPTYLVEAPAGMVVLRVRKRRSLIERRFIVERTGELPRPLGPLALPALVMLVLLERERG